MKKIAILLTVMLFCCGCSDKKQDDDISEEVTTTAETEVIPETEDKDNISETAETPDTGNTVVETAFRSYNENEFKKINVTFSYPDKKPPVSVESIILPEYDFGERLAVCKTSDDSGKYLIDDSIAKNPEKGVVEKAYKRDNKVYMIVNYDTMCMYCHEWAVFCYDVLTKKMEEVYTNSAGLDEDCVSLNNVFIAGNKLVKSYYILDEEKYVSHVDIIDLESGRSEEVFASEEYYTTVFSNGKDKLGLHIFSQTPTSNVNAPYVSSIIEYDMETGEKKYLTRDNKNDLQSFCLSDISGYIEKDSKNNNWNLITDNYSIDTDMIGAIIIYLSDKKAVMQDTALGKIHTYDLETMEHYIIKPDRYSGMMCSFDGNIIMSDGVMYGKPGDLYYIIPELGVAYKFAEGIRLADLTRYGDGAEFYEIENDNLRNGEPVHIIQNGGSVSDDVIQIYGNEAVSACVVKKEQQ